MVSDLLLTEKDVKRLKDVLFLTSVPDSLRLLVKDELEKVIENKEYTTNLENEMFDNFTTTYDYIVAASQLLSFLQGPTTFKTFITLIEPKQTLFLTTQEKLPEVYNNPGLSKDEVNKWSKEVTEQVEQHAFRLILLFTLNKNISIDPMTLPKMPELDLKVNSVFYQEDDNHIYSFQKNDLCRRLRNGNRKNPYTSKPFEKSFNVSSLCCFCDNDTVGKSIKSVVLNAKRKPVMVEFCSLDCMRQKKFSKRMV